MADALVAEKAKFEPPGKQGVLQSTCYAYRFLFLMVSGGSRTYAVPHVKSVGPRRTFVLLACSFPVCCVRKYPCNLVDATMCVIDGPSILSVSWWCPWRQGGGNHGHGDVRPHWPARAVWFFSRCALGLHCRAVVAIP